MTGLLLRDCEPFGLGRRADVRIANGRIAALADSLPALPGEREVHAAGGALLPGLHDHHIHLLALAAARASLHCGPPEVTTADALANRLASANAAAGDWLRGIGYHDSVAGDIDRHWLDRHLPDRPARLQHRGGRLWVLNSAALAALGMDGDRLPANLPDGVERNAGRATGRLYDCDRWLRERLPGSAPPIGPVSRELARRGITGVTDTTAHNGGAEWALFDAARSRGALRQHLRVMGTAALHPTDSRRAAGVAQIDCGELKVHLLESRLPDPDALAAALRAAHAGGRNVAVHCVTLVELAFALGCLAQAGVEPGDRIEHASVTPPAHLAQISALGLRVVTQPGFIATRGDHYLRDVEPADQPWLYRLRGFLDAGVPLAGSSDAPFGDPDPWSAMRAAVTRATDAGAVIGEQEALSPEQAIALFTSAADAPGVVQRSVTAGAVADLCLLHRPWRQARAQLERSLVSMTVRGGEVIYDAGARTTAGSDLP